MTPTHAARNTPSNVRMVPRWPRMSAYMAAVPMATMSTAQNDRPGIQCRPGGRDVVEQCLHHQRVGHAHEYVGDPERAGQLCREG